VNAGHERSTQEGLNYFSYGIVDELADSSEKYSLLVKRNESNSARRRTDEKKVPELEDDNEDDLDKKAHADREGTDTSRDHIDLGLKSSSDGGKNDDSGDAALSASTIAGIIFGSEGVICVLICASCAC
jgi:hypothetical protein